MQPRGAPSVGPNIRQAACLRRRQKGLEPAVTAPAGGPQKCISIRRRNALASTLARVVPLTFAAISMAKVDCPQECCLSNASCSDHVRLRGFEPHGAKIVS